MLCGCLSVRMSADDFRFFLDPSWQFARSLEERGFTFLRAVKWRKSHRQRERVKRRHFYFCWPRFSWALPPNLSVKRICYESYEMAEKSVKRISWALPNLSVKRVTITVEYESVHFIWQTDWHIKYCLFNVVLQYKLSRVLSWAHSYKSKIFFRFIKYLFHVSFDT